MISRQLNSERQQLTHSAMALGRMKAAKKNNQMLSSFTRRPWQLQLNREICTEFVIQRAKLSPKMLASQTHFRHKIDYPLPVTKSQKLIWQSWILMLLRQPKSLTWLATHHLSAVYPIHRDSRALQQSNSLSWRKKIEPRRQSRLCRRHLRANLT